MLIAITLGLPIFTVLMAFGNVLGVGAGTIIYTFGWAKRNGEGQADCRYSATLLAYLTINPLTRSSLLLMILRC